MPRAGVEACRLSTTTPPQNYFWRSWRRKSGPDVPALEAAITMLSVEEDYSTPSTMRKSRTAPSPSAFKASAYAALS